MSLEFRRIALAPDYVAGSDGSIVKVRGRGTASRDVPMRTHDNGYGYMKVRLVVPGGDRGMFYVHRIVCEAFHGLPPDYVDGPAVVRHMNDDSADNRAANLRWGYQSENEKDKYRRRRLVAKKVKFTCAKCGAVHLVSRGEDGEVAVELEDKAAAKPKKKKDDIFSFIVGESEDNDDET